jgi:hypothetical protein
MDTNRTLSGDAFSQTSTTIPTGTLAFTLQGDLASDSPIAAGGFMVTDGTGDITNASTEDFNDRRNAFSDNAGALHRQLCSPAALADTL